MHMHAYVPTYPAENLEDSAGARTRSRCSVMNLYEALEGLRCPGARLCRCLNRNSGLLRSYAVRAGRQLWTSTGKGEKADRGADRRDMKGSQVARSDEDTTGRDETVYNKIVRRENCAGYRDYKIDYKTALLNAHLR